MRMRGSSLLVASHDIFSSQISKIFSKASVAIWNALVRLGGVGLQGPAAS